MSDPADRPEQQQEDKLKLDFIALVSHELRMPVSAIIGYLELLLDHTYGPLTEEQEKTLGYINQNARDLLRMVNDLLQLTNLQAGRAQLTLEWANAHELTKNVLQHLAPLYRDKPLRVTASFPDNLPTVRTDASKLKQILVNLVSNAIKFTQEGEVAVSGREIPSPVGDGSRWLELEVRDTGVGIPAEKLGQLFKMFSQLDNRISREHEGMGLGLFISQYLARMLGGTITVASELGRGTIFTVRLPLEWESADAVRRLTKLSKTAATSVEAPRDEDEETPVGAGEQCVLVVGTDPNLPRLLGGSLKKEGFRAVRAINAAEALRVISSKKPQAVFVDLTHSQNEAWQMLQQLKADPAAQNLPVIYLTDYSEAPPKAGDGEGPLTVTTPVQPRQVVQTVRKAASFSNRAKKILVADDDPWMRTVLQTILTDEQYQVCLAQDGTETIQLLEQEKPDLLLLDLSMPGISGWDVIQHIYGNESLRHTRVIIITGHTLTEEETRLVSQNIQGFLTKSEFKIEKILDEVRAVMQNA